MKSTVEPLEGNKVKLVVEVDEDEFEKAVDLASKRISKEVNIKGFRRGKAPRRVLETTFGVGVLRGQAIEDSVPDYYNDAVREHEVDVIASPEIDVTGGEESGAVTFDAVVEVRPEINVAGYGGLRVEIPSPTVTDVEIEEQIDQIRGQYSDFEAAEREAATGDRVLIDIAATQAGEPVEGLTAEDYLYEVGSKVVVEEIDDNLLGATAGETLEFAADHPEDDEEQLHFTITVKEVQGTVMPELTDEWVAENSDYETVADFRDFLVSQMTRNKISQANGALRQKAGEALSELVEDEIPEPLIDLEVEDQIRNFAIQLQSQGIDPNMYLDAVRNDPDSFRGQFREEAEKAARLDLALRAVATAEGIEAEDADLDEQFGMLSGQLGDDVDEIRAQFERAGRLAAVRSDIRKGKALDWVVEQVEIVDEDGNPVDRADLEFPEDPEPDETELTAEVADETDADVDAETADDATGEESE